MTEGEGISAGERKYDDGESESGDERCARGGEGEHGAGMIDGRGDEEEAAAEEEIDPSWEEMRSSPTSEDD